MATRYEPEVVQDFLTIEQAARELNLGRTTAYVMARAGELETCMIAGRRFIRREVVDALLGKGSRTTG